MRIAVVTPLFPLPTHPHRGQPMYFTVRGLQKLAEVQVFCPMIAYPDWSQRFGKVNFVYARAPKNFSPPDVPATYFEYPGIPVVTRPINGWMSGRALRANLGNFKPDVILNYWLYPEGYGALQTARKLGVPVVVGSRGSDLLRLNDDITRRYTSKTVSQADGVLTVTEELRQRAIQMGAAPEKVHTIVNGCDTSIFHPGDRLQARQKLGIAPDAQVIVFVGWLSATKGVPELIQAAAGLKADHPKLKMILIGEGEARASYEQKVAELGVADIIQFAGKHPAPKIAEWLTAADLFSLPSHSEGCPNVVIEALSCGRPVVATTVGGIPELVSEEVGILVPMKQPSQLELALRVALTRKWDESKIAANFRRSWDDVGRETYSVCEGVLRK